MQDIINEPIRYNQGKVDWTLLPWDEEMLYEIQPRLHDIQQEEGYSNEDLFLRLLNKQWIDVLCNALLILDRQWNSRDTNVSNLPYNALEQVCRVFAFGATKYQRDNYKLAPGLPLETYIQSMWRHTVSYLKGEENDIDSGLSNLAHLACNCFMYLWTQKEYHSN